MTKLKAVRTLKGFTQKDLANLSGVSLRMVQHYEQGDFRFENIGVLVMLKFANVLGVSLSDLLDGEAALEAKRYDKLVSRC
jgi:transcriptional regulator with XRE-family HTH domain